MTAPQKKVFEESGILIELFDLGEELTAEFKRMYLALARHQPMEWAAFDSLSRDFLAGSESYEMDDAFFNNHTALWEWLIARGRYLQACNLWEERIRLAEECDVRNKRGHIHKGTPFYFLGYTHISHRDLYHGFLAMHRALDEDLNTHVTLRAITPALSFVKLDSKRSQQFARHWVEELAHYIEDKLHIYRQEWGGSLSIEDFRLKFLQRDDLTESVFSFVYQIAFARETEWSFDKSLVASAFGGISLGAHLFQLTLITDQIIGKQHPNPGEWHYFNRLLHLASKYPQLQDLRGRLEDVSGKTKPPKPVAPVMKEVLDGIFRYRVMAPVTEMEKDFITSYLLRNRGAHSLEPMDILLHSFPKTLQRILNPLFGSVETLY